MRERNHRVTYFDILKILAMSGVIMAHAGSNQWSHPSFITNWMLANTFISISLPSVPIFLMVSGALILNSPRTKSLTYLFLKRIPRLVIPFLIWSIATLWTTMQIDHHFGVTDFWHSFWLILTKPVTPAYWFVYPLIAFYLISPFLKAAIDNISMKTLDYILWLWLIIFILIPFFSSSLPKDISKYFHIYTFGSPLLGYFLLGYRLSKLKNTYFQGNSHLVISLMLMVLIVYENFFKFLYPELNFATVSVEQDPLVLLASMEIFLYFQSLEDSYPNWMRSTGKLVAPLSYGIYLIHGIVIEIVLLFVHPNDFLWIFVVTLVISTAVAFILSKIPIINKILV
ncbi:acyltransferase [Companilactobacillus metriopterae]|uniref:acyltransferase n=1 Tax=Companilactobacillus metriopterae TaxID=1909267 RepID=UPI0013E974D0|nr:acyltransferase [Companilactobacillus metriopterae]